MACVFIAMTADENRDTDEHTAVDVRRDAEATDLTRSASQTIEAALESQNEYDEADTATFQEALSELTLLAAGDDTEATVDDRISAIELLAELVARRPASADKVLKALEAALNDPVVETTALRALARITNEIPEAIDPVIDTVGRQLTTGPIPARGCAIQILGIRASDDPNAVARLSTRLVDAVVTRQGMDVDDPTLPDYERTRLHEQTVAEERLRQRTATVLEMLVAEDPDAIAPELDRLSEVIDPENARNPHLREQIVGMIESVAAASPEAAIATIDPLAATVTDENAHAALRGTAAGVLAMLAEARFETTTASLRGTVPALEELLVDADPAVRANAVSLLSYVAQQYPRAVESLTDTLVDSLDDDLVPIRASTVWTLGYVDTGAARDALRKTADADPDPDVRALATELLRRERTPDANQ